MQFSHKDSNAVPFVFNHRKCLWIVDERFRIPEFFMRGQVEPDLKALDSATMSSQFIIADLFVNGSPARTE